MNKIKIAITLASTLMLTTLTGCVKDNTQKIIASVESQNILSEDVYNTLYEKEQKLINTYGKNYEKKLSEEEKTYWEEEKQSALDSIIRNKLIISKAKELNIDTSEKTLETLINRKIDSLVSELGSVDEFNKFLSTNGYTYDEYKTHLKDSIIEELVLNKITEKISVSNADVYNYYKDVKDTYKTDTAAYVKVIAFSELNASTKNIISRINSDTFDSVFDDLQLQDHEYIKEYDLGVVTYSSKEYPEEFTKVLSETKKNNISDLIEIDGNHIILKVYNTYENDSIIPIDDIYDTLKENLFEIKRNELIESTYKEWLEESDVKILNKDF